ncbi:hypothetical protein AOLI_G00290660 [Acnodon oligacanthus]
MHSDGTRIMPTGDGVKLPHINLVIGSDYRLGTSGPLNEVLPDDVLRHHWRSPVPQRMLSASCWTPGDVEEFCSTWWTGRVMVPKSGVGFRLKMSRILVLRWTSTVAILLSLPHVTGDVPRDLPLSKLHLARKSHLSGTVVAPTRQLMRAKFCWLQNLLGHCSTY